MARPGRAVARQLKPGMESLGIVLSFITRHPPYDGFRAAKLVAAVQHQLLARCHVCLIENERLVAYAGWLPVAEANAEDWINGTAELRPVPSAGTGAAALTIVAVADGARVPPLIRACRKAAPQVRIYFKREYRDGRMRKGRVGSRK